LGPVLERDHPGLSLMVFDHNRNNVQHWADVIYNHPKASPYVDGIAFHWYEDGGERYMDGVAYPEHLNDTHFLDDSRFMLSSESSSCPGVAVGDEAWFRAQRYGHNILSALNNYAAGWIDWNLLLDHPTTRVTTATLLSSWPKVELRTRSNRCTTSSSTSPSSSRSALVGWK